MLAFHIGQDEAEYVRVEVTRDNGDGWLSAEVEIAVGAFRGRYSADFNSWAFSDFQAQLEDMNRKASGRAEFTSYEKQLELALSCDETGHILVSGEATDRTGTGNELCFQIQIDQTYVSAILSSLQKVTEGYPRRAG